VVMLPAHIEGCQQVGHWECDTVIGANHKQAIVTVVELKSGYAVMAKVSNKTADLVGAAIVEALNPLEARVKTLTYDNGKEFSGNAQIDEALSSTGYFARPFASWERGSNENFNGLLRQYVPKKRQMASITNEKIKMIENRLNNRPRKRLGYRTPAEVFHQSLSRVALRACDLLPTCRTKVKNQEIFFTPGAHLRESGSRMELRQYIILFKHIA
jgi:IS30 family transposase